MRLLITLVLNSLCCGMLFAGGPALRKAPELAFRIPGQGEQLLSHYRGKVVSLEFIHTTCSHCQDAAKIQQRMQQAYGARGFQAIDVAINPNADLLVDNFRKDFGLEFPVGWATMDQAMTFLGFSNADRPVVPQIVVIDRNGYIRAQTSPNGGDAQRDAIRTEEALTSAITSLLSASLHHAAR